MHTWIGKYKSAGIWGTETLADSINDFWNWKVQIFRAISAERIIGLYLFQEKSVKNISNKYMLVNYAFPRFLQLWEYNIFLQDGYPEHPSNLVASYSYKTSLDDCIGDEYLLIVHLCLLACHMATFLVTHFKSKIYAKRMDSIEELKCRIQWEIRRIDSVILKNLKFHLGYTIHVNLEHIEHLIYWWMVLRTSFSSIKYINFYPTRLSLSWTSLLNS